jgi:threonine aldolase
MKIDATRAAPGWQFASDNTAGICAEAWEALHAANVGYAPSYGEDAWTERACALIRALFEHDSAQVFFVFNGTAANSLSLAALTRSFEGIVCHEAAHVQTDECAAPEFFSGGAKLMPLPGVGAKLSAAAVLQLITRRDDLHYPRPRALSLSQPTEWGTLYQPAEIAALSAVAHAHGVSVQMAAQFDYRGKQAGQLASKMRFQSCQWQGVLESGAWLRHATHANAMAQRLAAAVSAVPGLTLARPVEVNAVFVDMSAAVAAAMFAMGWHFYTLSDAGYRLMCSWATTPEDVAAFVRDLQRVVSQS